MSVNAQLELEYCVHGRWEGWGILGKRQCVQRPRGLNLRCIQNTPGLLPVFRSAESRTRDHGIDCRARQRLEPRALVYNMRSWRIIGIG